ncbi:MAG: RNA recognition motif domain-containing protein [Rhodothermia bacterium]
MNIYCGNLSYDITEEDLQQLFEEFGPVVRTNIIKDRDTGNPKGFGFVEMENQADGQKAIEDLDGTPVKGRDIRVNEARPRADRPKPRRREW